MICVRWSEIVNDEMRRRNLSRDWLGAQLGISGQAASKMIARTARPRRLPEIAKALEIPLESLTEAVVSDHRRLRETGPGYQVDEVAHLRATIARQSDQLHRIAKILAETTP